MIRKLVMAFILSLTFFIFSSGDLLAATDADEALEVYLDSLYESGDFDEEDFDDFERLMYLAEPKLQITGDDSSSSDSSDSSSSDNSSSDSSSSDSSSSDSSSSDSSSTTEGTPDPFVCSLRKGDEAGSGKNVSLVILLTYLMMLMLARRRVTL